MVENIALGVCSRANAVVIDNQVRDGSSPTRKHRFPVTGNILPLPHGGSKAFGSALATGSSPAIKHVKIEQDQNEGSGTRDRAQTAVPEDVEISEGPPALESPSPPCTITSHNSPIRGCPCATPHVDNVGKTVSKRKKKSATLCLFDIPPDFQGSPEDYFAFVEQIREYEKEAVAASQIAGPSRSTRSTAANASARAPAVISGQGRSIQGESDLSAISDASADREHISPTGSDVTVGHPVSASQAKISNSKATSSKSKK